MNYSQLVEQIYKKKSFLCVGLDTDYSKIPEYLLELGRDEGCLAFNKAIIDATAPYAVAFKPNVAFYECLGSLGTTVLEATISYIKRKYPDILVIADAKRGDIGNTSEMYAKAFFDVLGADAVTVAPYMGKDSVAPFLSHEGKWSIILGLTSNIGSFDFQHLKLNNKVETPLYEQVIYTVSQWGNKENTMFVAGATQAEMLEDIRNIVPEHFLLVPGVGAQGGSLEEVARHGMVPEICGLLVNASRSIIYAGHDKSFAEAAAEEAADLQSRMACLLKFYGC